MAKGDVQQFNACISQLADCTAHAQFGIIGVRGNNQYFFHGNRF
jgi:hypothetical protein